MLNTITLPQVYLNFQTSLASKMSDSASDFTLFKSTDDEGNTLSGRYLLTFDEGEAFEEHIVCTLSGATGTVVTRGLSRVDAFTNVPGNQFEHQRDATVKITNVPVMMLQRLLDGTDTFAAVNWTGVRSITNVSYVAPADDADYVMKLYVDQFVSGGTINITRLAPPGTAGETVAAGNSVYQKGSDQRWWKTDASDSAKCENVTLGVAQGAGTAGGSISGGVLISGKDITVTGLTAGKVYLSDTPGAFSASAGTIEVTVGIAEDATTLIFTPRYDQVITEDIQDALAGTLGTPSAGNLYATELGNQKGAEVWAIDAVGTDAYAATFDPVPTALVAGMAFRVQFGTANIGASTFKPNALAVKALTKNGATALDTDDITANMVSWVVYDGTQWQLMSVASYLTRVNHDLLTSSGDTVIHSHPLVLGLNPANTHYTYLLNPNDWGLTDCALNAKGAKYVFAASAATWEAKQGGLMAINGDTDDDLHWDSAKDLTIEFRGQVPTAVVGDRIFGFATANGFQLAYNANGLRVAFATDGSTLYATTGQAGASTEVDISSGINILHSHTYRIEFDPGVDADFYVDGVFKTKITTTLPAANSAISVGCGGTTNAERFAISPIILRQEL